MAAMRPAGRLPLLFFGMLSLLGGVLAGLARLGWNVPAPVAQASGVHCPLMIAAFFGTVIGVDCGVAIRHNWAFLGPLAAGTGGIALLAGAPLLLGQVLGTLGALGLLAASVVALRRQWAVFTIILASGAACWLLGNLIWLAGNDVLQAIPWWLLFLVLTIAGERLELTRFLPTPPIARSIFIAIVALLLAAATGNITTFFAGGLLLLAGWLLRYDIARRNIGTQGLTRFIAACPSGSSFSALRPVSKWADCGQYL